MPCFYGNGQKKTSKISNVTRTVGRPQKTKRAAKNFDFLPDVGGSSKIEESRMWKSRIGKDAKEDEEELEKSSLNKIRKITSCRRKRTHARFGSFSQSETKSLTHERNISKRSKIKRKNFRGGVVFQIRHRQQLSKAEVDGIEERWMDREGSRNIQCCFLCVEWRVAVP